MQFLNEREELVLKAIVDEFVQSNEPVGSRLISKTGPLKLGAASIRNIMSDLEDKGYIIQPHTSAGRIPSDEGYRYYIDRLVTFDLSDTDLMNRLKDNISADNINGVFKKVSDNLSRLTGSVGFVISPGLNTTLLKHIEFIRLNPATVLAIIVAKTGMVHNVMLNIDQKVTDAELLQISNYLNSRFQEKSLMELKSSLAEEMKKDKAQMDSLFTKLYSLAGALFENNDMGQDLIVSGTTAVLDVPEFSDVSRLKGLLSTFEEKKFIFDILDKCQNEKGVNIFVGSEIGRADISELGLVTKTYSRGGSVIGMLGIIGPKRMKYSSVVSVVDCSAELMSQIMGKFLGNN